MKKMAELVNFTDETCLDFGKEQNLPPEKSGAYHALVRECRLNLECSEAYKRKIDEILDLDATEWGRISDDLLKGDKTFSREMQKKGLSHYAVKYNRFMGVISDYFLNEK